MKLPNKLLFLSLLFLTIGLNAMNLPDPPVSEGDSRFAGEYKLVIEGFDWGPAVNKVILKLDETVTSVNGPDFNVTATRKSDKGQIQPAHATGSRAVVYSYVSDDKGARVESGNHVALVLAVSPIQPIGSPIQYFPRLGNVWIDYQLQVTNAKTGKVWDSEIGRMIPLVDKFDLTGKFKYDDALTMSYASYSPPSIKDKAPLIIWLHGGGEGGTDPTIPLLGNRAANYASEEIQVLFGEGAFVLVPQTPTFWMQGPNGMTRGDTNDIYNEALMALIKNYVQSNPKIDPARIYVGGCSNGGYMSLKLILEHPDYFAAGYISALAYNSEFITDQQIEKIKNVPMWFVHAKDDNTTKPEETVVPVVDRLRKAGAKNIHFTYYDYVSDITGFYGGDDFRYSGHWSWIYVHANKSRTDLDGSPVLVHGRPATIMEWLAAQKK